MTHTTPGQERKDVSVAKGSFWVFSGAAYGWENIKRLAKQGPYVELGHPKAADNNADSISYFALGKSARAMIEFLR